MVKVYGTVPIFQCINNFFIFTNLYGGTAYDVSYTYRFICDRSSHVGLQEKTQYISNEHVLSASSAVLRLSTFSFHQPGIYIPS